jgi:hypothetical protein
MRGLVRHHGVIRGLPKLAAVAAATATLAVNLMMYDRARHGGLPGVGDSGLLQLVILLGGLGFLAPAAAGVRAPSWARALPLPSRQLWRAHLQALALAVSLLVVCMALVVNGFAGLLRQLGETDLPAPTTLLLHFARPWLVLVAVALVAGSWRPGLADPGRAAGWVRLRWALVASAPLVLLALLRAPLAAGLLPVLLAAGWARRSCRGLPPALSVAERAGSATGAGDGPGATDGRRVLHAVVARQLFKWPLTWILGLPLVLALGLVQGGLFSRMPDADFARYFNVAITVYLLVAFVGHFLENLHRVDHLPIPRGLLLRWLLLPGIASLLAGGLIGAAVDRGRPPGESLVYANDGTAPHGGLLVPPDFWRPAWGAPPDSITAPWGERRPTVSVAAVAGWPLHLWKPYATDPAASAEFVAWQVSRAARAIHGVDIAPDLIRERYFVTAADGSVQVRDGGLSLVADGLVPPRGAVGPVLALLLGATIVPTLLVCALIFSLCGPGATRRRVKVVFWTVMAALMALHFAGYALLMARVVQDWVVSGLVTGCAGRLGAAGPLGWVGAWLLAGGASALAWRLCAKAFARVEAVRTRPGPGS